MKKKWFILSGLLIVSVGIILGLYHDAVDNQELQTPFERRSAPTPVQRNHIRLTTTRSYFAGVDDRAITLGSNKNLTLTRLDKKTFSMLSSRTLRIQSPIPPRTSNIKVDGDTTYLFDASSSTIYRGENNGVLKPFPSNSVFITEVVPLHTNSFVIRTLKENARELTIAKLYGDSLRLVRAPNLLQKQVDGIFCTDGKLHYSRKMNSFIYIYFYRNEFIRFDTSLNITYRAHTIDTFAHAKLKVSANPLKRITVLYEPPAIINPKSFVGETRFYVASAVYGINEQRPRRSAMIDVYELADGTYTHSFAIPAFENESMTDFITDENMLFVLYDHHLVKYDLTP